MKTELKWKDGMTFEAKARTHSFTLSSADFGGKDDGACPKEHLIGAVLGCTGMDVLALLKKHRIEVKGFKLTGNAESRDQHPKIFSQIDIVYDFDIALTDEEKDIAKVVECVRLSMTKYCGVSAMVAPTSPIFYTVVINGEIQARDEALFPAEI